MSARTGSRRLLAVCMVSGVLLTGVTVAAASVTSGSSGLIPIIDDTPSATPTATGSAAATPSASATASSSASATASGTPALAPTFDEDGLYTQPRKSCLQFADVPGDATTNPVSADLDPDDDLDLTGVVYKTSTSALQVFVKETALDTAPSSGLGLVAYDGHVFSTRFTLGGQAITLSASATGPAKAAVTGATAPSASPSASASASASGTPSTGVLHPTATFDVKNSNIVFSVPRLELATLVGAPILGTRLTSLSAASTATSSMGFPDADADSAAPTKDTEKAYLVGDNTCFQPPAAKLFLSGLTATYTDQAAVTARIQDAGGAHLAGEVLTLHISGLPDRALRSNASGEVIFRFKETVHSGTRPATLSFAGSTAAGRANLSDLFTIRVESTVVKVAATRGLLTATLLDNDNAPIAKRHVTFTVGSRRYNVTTDAKGKALLRGVAKGATVKVSFAAVPTLYSAARTVAVRAL